MIVDPQPRSALALGLTASGKPSPELSKYQGVHRQEDRDFRTAVRAAGTEKKTWNMIRIRIPMGTLSADQYLAMDQLSERVTYNRSLRATAGRSLQLHGISEGDLAHALDQVAKAGLSAGCSPLGLEFAVAGPPSPLVGIEYERLRAIDGSLCAAFYPAPGEAIESPGHAPRKFSIGLALPEDNSANVYANDVGLILVDGAGPAPRVNVLVGGGLSMPGRRSETYARIGTPIGSVALEDVLAAVRAVATVFRECGEIATRRFTRLKYVVDQQGTEAFRARLAEALNGRLGDWVPLPEFSARGWLGPHDQGNGLASYGIKVPNGRVIDTGLTRFKTALGSIVRAFRPKVILTPAQDIIFADLKPSDLPALEAILRAYHIPFGGGLSPVRAAAMACAGLPTCPLALAESERVIGPVVDELERELERIGKKQASFVFRISGCSIGCIRPNMVDLGAVARAPARYDLFVGGNETTGHFGELYAEKVPLDEIVSVVRPLLAYWGRAGQSRETFRGFYQRCCGGPARQIRLLPTSASPARGRVEALFQCSSSPAPILLVANAAREFSLTP